MEQGKLFTEIEKYSCITEIGAAEVAKFEAMFGETCAMFVLDSTGFTRIVREKGNLYFLFFIKNLRLKCKEVFLEYKPIDYRFHADNVYAEFADVQTALKCAEVLHDFFQTERFMISDTEIFQACIGIGYGKVVRCDLEGVFGDEMNTACKLGEDTADGGDTLLTEGAFGCIDFPEDKVEVESISISGVDINFYKLTF